ncbi:NADH-quinone oxidoreductase subunit M [Synechococcus sp. CCY 9618]|uniref:NADH-quinone oxidoreductase subunit M n=1 Tax=Synechococcus sp. CCY 9618 TaxID=2815602 RepID=UPI001C229029|nr:NADH-quinone oxidoreductase subunit M [Synechococcus sp. CCY 9618]
MALLLLLLLPAFGAVLLPLLPERQILLRRVCLVPLVFQFALGLGQLGQAPSELHQVWLPRIGLALDLGLDGLSAPLAALIALIVLVTVLATPADQARPRLFLSLLLATDLGLMGAVLARNGLLFLLAFELVLIPTTLLLAIWGGPRRAQAAIQYVMYGAVSGLSLLGAVLALGWLSGNGFSFAYTDLAALELSPQSSRWILALFLLAFGLKLPVVPLHGWQPLAYSQASSPVAMLLSGGVSILGGYGLLRFAIGFLPEEWILWSPWIAGVGALTAAYGALNALAQSDIRRLVAYGSLGHMGLLVVALAAATPLSLQGVEAQLLAHGLISALLFHLVGLIESKTGSTLIPDLAGLLNPYRGLPFTLGLFLLALMASAGIPGLAGFVPEFLMFEASWTPFPVPTILCLIASGFTAVYAVRLFNRVGFGRLDNDRVDYPATVWSERFPAVLLAALVVVGGIWPGLLVGWSESSTSALALRREPFPPLVATATSASPRQLPS